MGVPCKMVVGGGTGKWWVQVKGMVVGGGAVHSTMPGWRRVVWVKNPKSSHKRSLLGF